MTEDRAIGELVRVELQGYKPAGIVERQRADVPGGTPAGPSNIDDVRDVTGHIVSLSFGSSTSSPYEPLSLSLAVPYGDWARVFPGLLVRRSAAGGTQAATERVGQELRSPAPGFWVVVRLADARGDWPAIAWGRCNAVSLSLDVGQDGMIHAFTDIQCESWLDFAARSRVVLTATQGFTAAGTHYVGDWLRKLEGLFKGLTGHLPGELLSDVWAQIMDLGLPTTLVEGDLGSVRTIGQEIPVVWDRKSCADYAPLRLPQQLAVPGEIVQAFGGWEARGSLWGWIQQTFAPDSPIVEIFPSLEWPSDLRPAGAYKAGEPTRPEDGTGRPSTVPVNGEPRQTTKLGRALGAQPVLMYRVKPLVLRAINQASADGLREELERRDPTVRSSEWRKLYAHDTYAEIVAEETGKTTSYGQEPVSPHDLVMSGWYWWTREEVTEFRVSFSDSDRINAVYCKSWATPGTQLELYGAHGVPVIDTLDAQRHGLRLYDGEWPFFEAGGAGDLGTRISALSDLFWSLLSNTDTQHFFGTGSIGGEFRPWLRAGHWCAAGLPRGGVPAEQDSGLEGADGGGLTGYIESVTHELHVDPSGKVSRDTTLQLARVSMLGSGKYPVNLPLRGERLPVKSFVIKDGEVIWGDLDEYGNFAPDAYKIGAVDATGGITKQVDDTGGSTR
jgi:hypothetical protein